ncbi:MAG: YebC/PmpR family DNA-binding transcriptional regulator [Gammaproteobacteria bacterium]
MAGHSKWANIQHRKNAQDAKRGKLFTRLIREISSASRMGGVDAGANPRLRLAIDKALAANMSKDTVERAIKRGAGELDDVVYEEVRYEGYGPGGAAVIVDCMTDNRNRTVAEVRHVFNKCGGNLGTTGSVAFQFSETGTLAFPPGSSEDRIMEVALEAGANDVIVSDDGSIEVLTDPSALQAVKSSMMEARLAPEEAAIAMRPNVTLTLAGEDAEKMVKLLDMLEDLDDTQNVYSNAELPEDVLAQVHS